MPIFKRNIDTTGRVIRGVLALGLLVGAILVWPHSRWGAVGLGLGAAFCGFEASMSWCAVRACGIKTKF